MRITRLAVSSVMALAFSAAAIGAQTAQQPTTPADQKAATASSPITVAGCVQKESLVLKRNPAATNVGMDDEFVLTFAALNPSPATDAPKPDVAPQPTGTAGTAGSFGVVYRVTGDKENELKSYVGQRVEITGNFKDKDAASTASSVGTSGRTGELTPANTPEITIDAIKPATGPCPPAIK
jgi:hypothetical protein